VRLSWYAPLTRIRDIAPDSAKRGTADDYYKPWYAGRFPSIEAVDA
jgi:hypothetical protein